MMAVRDGSHFSETTAAVPVAERVWSFRSSGDSA
jgi:hypothetical protein